MATLSFVWIVILITWRAQSAGGILLQRMRQHIIVLIDKFMIANGKYEYYSQQYTNILK